MTASLISAFNIVLVKNLFTQALTNPDLLLNLTANSQVPRNQDHSGSMVPAKPTSRFILFTLFLLLLISFFITANTVIASGIDTENGNDYDDEDNELDELLAIDQEELEHEQDSQVDGVDSRFSEAKVLSRAQRIVVELNTENLKEVTEGNEFVLVLGYAPWCPRSAELMPQFAEAATLLKELKCPILMAKLDADRYPKAASALEIKGFPTLLFFVNGTSQAYTGGFSAYVLLIGFLFYFGVRFIISFSYKCCLGP